MTPSTLPTTAEALHQKLTARTAHVGIVGLGYVGLPLAVEMARAGFKTTGIDLDHRKVETIMRGESYIPDVHTRDVAEFRQAGRLFATTDPAVVSTLDTINICVPTPLRKTKDPDLSYVVSAVEMIADHLHPGQLVILESTTYPGTTDEVVRPILERGGLVAGRDFFLAFSPERVDPGNEKWTTRNVPKVVGGLTPTCSALARALYAGSIERVIDVSSPKVAEMVKLLENTFRSVNIALANEIALMCSHMKINVWEVIKAASSKPFGFMPFYPGPGLGGHCIPIDPLYLEWKSKIDGFESRFIGLADKINSGMPRFVATRTMELLNEQGKAIRGSKIHILGVTYKKDISDSRESPAIEVIKLLLGLGAEVSYSDPFVSSLTVDGQAMESVQPCREVLSSSDLAIVITNHTAFNYPEIVKNAPVVFDTRNATEGLTAKNIVRL